MGLSTASSTHPATAPATAASGATTPSGSGSTRASLAGAFHGTSLGTYAVDGETASERTGLLAHGSEGGDPHGWAAAGSYASPTAGGYDAGNGGGVSRVLTPSGSGSVSAAAFAAGEQNNPWNQIILQQQIPCCVYDHPHVLPYVLTWRTRNGTRINRLHTYSCV